MSAKTANKQPDGRVFFDEINAAALSRYPSLLQEWFPRGRINRQEFTIGNINGDEGESLKVNLQTGKWADFAANLGGANAVSLYAQVRHISYKEAGLDLAKQFGIAQQLRPQNTQRWMPVRPVPDSAPLAPDGRPILPPIRPGSKLTRLWQYLDADGQTLSWRARFDSPGKKDILPLTYCRHLDTGEFSWRWRDLDAPRPLYGLEWLASMPDAPVLIVEGEKACDAARELFPEWVVITWSGGCKNVDRDHTDWSPVQMRPGRLVLWPDNDREGKAAMARLAEVFGRAVEMIKPDPAWPEKHDLADLLESGWTPEVAEAYLTQHAITAEPPKPQRQKIEIDLTRRDLGENTDKIWEAIEDLNSPPELFDSGAGRVLIQMDFFGRAMRRELSLSVLRGWLCERVAFRYSKNDTLKACYPPDMLIENAQISGARNLPKLHRLAETPVFSAEGRLVAEPGFNEPSGIYYAPPPHREIEIDANHVPSRTEAEAARHLILDLIADFPFMSATDQTHAILFAMLPLVRPMIVGRTPLFRFEAPQPRTGKSLLMRVLARLTCSYISDISPTDDEEEWRKRITAVLREEPEAVLIDNVERLESAQVKKALTDDIWEDRALGSNKTLRVPVKCVWAASINNPIMSAEIMGRSVRVRMDARSEHPELRRDFRHPALEKYATDNWQTLVAALLTMAQFGIADLDENVPVKATLGGFEAFCRVMGTIAIANDLQGFMEDRDDMSGMSNADSALAELVRQWGEHWGTQWTPLRDLVVIADEIDGFDLGRSDKDRGKLTSLGMTLQKHRGATIGEWKIDHSERIGNVTKWRLEKLKRSE